MSKMKFILFLVVFFLSCDRQNTDINSFKIENAYNLQETKSINDIANDISYIRLETNDSCIVGINPIVFATESKIIVTAQGRIMLFERTTGKYIHDIGNKGKGPNEYHSVSSLLPINYNDNSVLAKGNNKLLKFGFDGRLLQDISIPENINNSILLDENHFVSYFPNYSGENKIKISVYTLDGIKEVSLPNYQKAPTDGSFHFWMPTAGFVRYENELFFTELFNDTLYEVTPLKITPRMVLGLGKFLPPYEHQNLTKFSSLFSDKYFLFRNIHESSRYIFYTFRYKEKTHTAVYDKKQMESAISSEGGFKNDIDNFISISLSSVNQSDELVGVINAFEIDQWINASNPNNLPNNLESMKLVTKNDNPVIAIVKLKK